MDIVAAGLEVGGIADGVVGETALPDGETRGEAVGEAALDELHGSFEDDVLRGQKKMDVIKHHDEGVEFVEPWAR